VCVCVCERERERELYDQSLRHHHVGQRDGWGEDEAHLRLETKNFRRCLKTPFRRHDILSTRHFVNRLRLGL
jgi:hypothetical protein